MPVRQVYQKLHPRWMVPWMESALSAVFGHSAQRLEFSQILPAGNSGPAVVKGSVTTDCRRKNSIRHQRAFLLGLLGPSLVIARLVSSRPRDLG